ncbi:MAG TPA: hypothetical protein VGQ17_11575 [Gemmatimonadales bacterium]|jgi:hypothetical protein|nr:hypothetical protein [Gemmatimonadales bacterium]
MASFRWTPARMEQLERAAQFGRRVVLMRRGTEYIVIAKRLLHQGPREILVGYLPMTGEELRFELEELDEFQVLP